MSEFRERRREPLKEERDIEEAGREEIGTEDIAEIGLKWDGFKMVRDGRRDISATE